MLQRFPGPAIDDGRRASGSVASDFAGLVPEQLGEMAPLVEVGHVGVGLAEEGGIGGELAVVEGVGDRLVDLGGIGARKDVLAVTAAVDLS